MSEQVVIDREAPLWAQRFAADINALLNRTSRAAASVSRRPNIIDVRDFGLKDSTTFDNQPLLASALDSGEPLFFPPTEHGFRVEGPIQMHQDGQHIYGAGRNRTIIRAPGSGFNAVEIGDGTNEVSFLSIRNLSIVGEGTKNFGDCGVRINKTTEVDVSDLFISGGFWGGIINDKAHFNRIERVRINGLKAGGVGVWIAGDGSASSSLENYLSRVFVEGDVSSAAAPNWGYLIEDNQAFFADHCTAIYCQIGTKVRPSNAANKIEHVWFNTCLMDLNHLYGLEILTAGAETVRRLLFANGWASSNGEYGILVDGVSHEMISIEGNQVYNNGKEGIVVAVGSDVQISNNEVAGNSTDAAGTYPGIRLGSGTGIVTGVRVTGNKSGTGGGFPNLQSYGVQVAATASDYLIIGDNDLRNNSLGGLIDSSTTGAGNKRIANNLP
jgi:parallel beta-helix repeat protein